MSNDGSKGLFFVSLTFSIYFIFDYLNYHIFHLDVSLFWITIFFGVINEIIPLVFIQVVLLLISFILWVMNQFKIKTYSFWSCVILLISISLVFI